MKHLLLLLCLFLSACATVPALPTSAQPVDLFRDALFAKPVQQVNPDDVFALSDAMTRYLQFDIARQLRSDGPARGLVTALYRRDQLKLNYDTLTTPMHGASRRSRCDGLCMTIAFETNLLTCIDSRV